ncbi:hypothetical protein [Flammeovirga aprica]|uniref:Uncharacterized protein n=1 Tax=Flammeovirga aprica JL-4 TaxID=694437 RepID=A0A7X9RZR3_9BACT|nr:hypothetical protein [Flammeovirga aprica]NME71675.1 hypothetical protein [Flammeovirga aprica JL-4]
MKKIIIVIFLSLCSLTMFGQEQPVTYIKLEVKHPMGKIPYNYVKIEIIKSTSNASKVTLSLNSRPSLLDGQWDYSNKNETYDITVKDFHSLSERMKDLDITQYLDKISIDGYSAIITYGNVHNNISYRFGGLQEGKNYSITSLCQDILMLSKLDPDEIL